jgi:glycerophosphoryl diester phosphodiesterase
VTRRHGLPAPPVFASAGPQVFGHRGGLARAPENTMLAFARAMAAGADGFECDVRMSADGVPVVIHDATLDRTTDHSGPVGARTAAELGRIDATCRFVAVRPEDAVPVPEGVPRLADVLDTFRTARLIVELKDASPAVADAVAALVRRAAGVTRVCVGSFNHEVLVHLRAVAPDITTSASMREARWLLIRARTRWPFPWSPSFRALQVPRQTGRLRVVSPAFVGRAHREGALVQVWTVNDPVDMRDLLAVGVDGLITDVPDVAVAIRDRMAGGPLPGPGPAL